MLFKKTRTELLASDFAKTDESLRVTFYTYLGMLQDKKIGNKRIDEQYRGNINAMSVNYIMGDRLVMDTSNQELMNAYDIYGKDIPNRVDEIVRKDKELLWIIVQTLRGRLNVLSALDHAHNPAEVLETETGQRIWELLEKYSDGAKEALDYPLLKKRLGAFENKTFSRHQHIN